MFVLGFALLFLSPVLGVVLILCGAAAAASDAGGETQFSSPEWERSLSFGPEGPPWASEEEPFESSGGMIFASAIAKVLDLGPSPPDLFIKNGRSESISGTEKPARVYVTLHNGDEICLTGSVADRLRQWFDRAGQSPTKG